MATSRADDSDAELRDAVIVGWHRLISAVKSKHGQLNALAELTGVPFRRLDMVRHVRNQIAHPDTPVSRERMVAALETIAEAEGRLEGSESERSCRPEKNPGVERVGNPKARIPYPVLPSRRLSLNKPSTLTNTRSAVPRNHVRRVAPHRVDVHVTAGGEPVPRFVHMSDLGISWRPGRVVSDAPWLHGEIVGRSIRLTVEPSEDKNPKRGLLRIRGREGDVTIIVNVFFRPMQTRVTGSVRGKSESILEFAYTRHKHLPHQEDALMAVAVVLSVVAILVLVVAVS